MSRTGHGVIQGSFPNGLSRLPKPSATPAQPQMRGSVPVPPAVVQRTSTPHSATAVSLPRLPVKATSAGQPLPPAVRQKMEAVFRTSFGDVRVHVGPEASSIGAVAFTQGCNIHFAPGQYNPSTPHGEQVLGRELAHVVQQRSGRVANPFGSGVAVVQDRVLEAEADRLSRGAARHPAPVQAKATRPGSRGVRQRLIGLAALFGGDEWDAGGTRAPTGAVQTTAATSLAFENLRNNGQIDAAALVALIPAACHNTFEVEARTQRGFKYDWLDGNGVAWRVWGHEPDAGAPAGHAGAAGWTVRIRRNGNRFLMSQQVVPPQGNAYDWHQAGNPAQVQASHITLINV
jgi:hypothetical protein